MQVVSTTVTQASAGQIAVDSFSKTEYRSAKYIVTVSDTDDSTFATTEVMFIHNGTAVSVTQFGDVNVGSGTVPQPVIDGDISGSNARLLVTTNSNNQNIKITRFATAI